MIAKLIQLFKSVLGLNSQSPSADDAKGERLLQQSLEKYKHQYDYSVEILKEESDRFNRMDDKAAKLSTNSLLLVGASAFFGKWITEKLLPPQNCIEFLIIWVSVAALGSSFAGWFAANYAIRMRPIARRPLNEEMFKHYEDNDLLTIYYSLSKRNAEAFEDNVRATVSKQRWLTISFWLSACASAFLIIMALLYGCHFWHNPVRFNRDKTMSTPEHKPTVDSNPTTPRSNIEIPAQAPKPNKNVVAPQNILLNGSNSAPDELKGLKIIATPQKEN